MNIWLILWGLVAAGLIGFSIWTFLIVQRQKYAWKVYAERRKFSYDSGALVETPVISGVVDGYTVSCFASEHSRQDARLSRKLTAIEVKLNSIMPFDGGVANGGMVEILKILELKHNFVPDFADWNKEYIAQGTNKAMMKAYMNDKRLKALCDLFQEKHSWVIFVFKEDACLLRIDTPDPLVHPKTMDALIKKMVDCAQSLELEKGEVSILEKAEFEVEASKIELEVDDKVLDEASSLTLEEDAQDEEDKASSEKPEKDDGKKSSKKKKS